jgi:hypothetical protein
LTDHHGSNNNNNNNNNNTNNNNGGETEDIDILIDNDHLLLYMKNRSLVGTMYQIDVVRIYVIVATFSVTHFWTCVVDGDTSYM